MPDLTPEQIYDLCWPDQHESSPAAMSAPDEALYEAAWGRPDVDTGSASPFAIQPQASAVANEPKLTGSRLTRSQVIGAAQARVAARKTATNQPSELDQAIARARAADARTFSALNALALLMPQR